MKISLTAIFHAENGTLDLIEKDLKLLRDLPRDEVEINGFDGENFYQNISQRSEDLKCVEDTNNKIQNQIDKTKEQKRLELGLTVGQRLVERRISETRRDIDADSQELAHQINELDR